MCTDVERRAMGLGQPEKFHVIDWGCNSMGRAAVGDGAGLSFTDGRRDLGINDVIERPTSVTSGAVHIVSIRYNEGASSHLQGRNLSMTWYGGTSEEKTHNFPRSEKQVYFTDYRAAGNSRQQFGRRHTTRLTPISVTVHEKQIDKVNPKNRPKRNNNKQNEQQFVPKQQTNKTNSNLSLRVIFAG